MTFSVLRIFNLFSGSISCRKRHVSGTQAARFTSAYTPQASPQAASPQEPF